MANETKKRGEGDSETMQPGTTDAIRHVGKTLEAEGTFLPSDELPENRIEAEGLTETVNMNAVTADPWDREADARGAERLKTRLPGDRNSEPHDDTVADNATTLDDERNKRRDAA